MGLIEALEKVNKSKAITGDKYCYLKGYYLSMYRFYMMRMYDEGYISDPTFFNESEIRRNILDLGIIGFFNKIGIFKINYEYALYSMYQKENLSAEKQEFLYLLVNALMYRKYCEDLDKYYEIMLSKYNYSKHNIGPRIKRDKGYFYSLHYLPLSKATARLFVQDDETVEYIGVEDYVHSLVIKELNLESGRLDSSIPYSIELQLLELLTSEDLPNGKKRLVEIDKWLEEDKSLSNSNLTFIQRVGLKYFEDIMSRLEKLCNEYSDRIVLLANRGFYIRKKIHFYNAPVDFFTIIVDTTGERLIENSDKINSYTGECYSKEYLDSEGYSYMGIPLCIDNTLMYDKEQTNVSFDSFFKTSISSFEFDIGKTHTFCKDAKEAIENTKCGILGVYERSIEDGSNYKKR